MADTRKFRVKRDHPGKGWKTGQEVPVHDLDDAEIEELKRQGVIEDAAAGQGQRQGDPQPAPGTKPQGTPPQGSR